MTLGHVTRCAGESPLTLGVESKGLSVDILCSNRYAQCSLSTPKYINEIRLIILNTCAWGGGEFIATLNL